WWRRCALFIWIARASMVARWTMPAWKKCRAWISNSTPRGWRRGWIGISARLDCRSDVSREDTFVSRLASLLRAGRCHLLPDVGFLPIRLAHRHRAETVAAGRFHHPPAFTHEFDALGAVFLEPLHFRFYIVGLD